MDLIKSALPSYDDVATVGRVATQMRVVVLSIIVIIMLVAWVAGGFTGCLCKVQHMGLVLLLTWVVAYITAQSKDVAAVLGVWWVL